MDRLLVPTTNADGLKSVPMTEEQRYTFDLKGWIALPGLLTAEQLESIRTHQLQLLDDRESLPPEQRDSHGGPSQILLDHPVIVGILNEILSHQALAAEDCYGFRCDHTFTSRRAKGDDNFMPHGGGGHFKFNGNSHQYQMHPGSICSGLTRVVWELTEVGPGDGGTLFMSGSHKAAFDRPESLSARDSDLWETYTCPAGSAVVFAEALCHTGTRWHNSVQERLALFTCYNSVNAKWGKDCPSQAVIDAMAPKRRTLFRGVWHGMSDIPGINQYYDPQNTGRLG